MVECTVIQLCVGVLRAQQKIKQLRRLKPEELKLLSDEGIELDMTDYQKRLEEKEVQRKQQKDEKMTREALLTLEALEREEQEAALREGGEQQLFLETVSCILLWLCTLL